MKVAVLTPAPQGPAEFSLARLGQYPDASGCYVLTNVSGDIIYIGQAVNLRSRLSQHLEGGKHRALTSVGRASVVWHLQVPPPQLSSLERGWLNLCELADGALPPLNKVAAPV